MSLSQEQMLDVMAFADGELEGDDLARVQALVESDGDAKELLSSLHAIGDGVRSSFDVRDIDIRDEVMRDLKPNDFDKARIKRTARVRIAVVSASFVAPRRTATLQALPRWGRPAVASANRHRR